MLCELYIENLAVIEKATICFDNGLNVFTGETGAGKSIVIDAINAVLGQRTSREIVRHGTAKAVIIASFRDISAPAKAKMLELGYDDNELVITREISADGKGSARIMGKPITIAMLKEVGSLLINIHGQHDNQVLLSVEKHIDILDQYGELSKIYSSYYECYKSVVLIKREMKKLAIDEQEKKRRIDILSEQIDEINEADYTKEEEESLDARRLSIRNSEKILQGLDQCYCALNGDDDGGAVSMVQACSAGAARISDVFEPIEELATRLEGIYYELDDAKTAIREFIDGFEINPNELEVVENRLDQFHRLKRKYGSDFEEVSSFLEKAIAELDEITMSDKKLAELQAQGTAQYERLLGIGAKLTQSRKLAGARFVKAVTEELVFLDMPNVRLEVLHEKVKPTIKGQDSIEFLISTNKGEPPKPIARIASGGELSRIMLAIKNSLADKDDIQTLIFDEIDTGVSGRAAQKIGLKLRQAAKNRQIISVTHLAQIAALADHHFLISKESDKNNTFTKVEKLDLDGRVNEVARIMSTDKITDLMLQNAREMITS